MVGICDLTYHVFENSLSWHLYLHPPREAAAQVLHQPYSKLNKVLCEIAVASYLLIVGQRTLKWNGTVDVQALKCLWKLTLSTLPHLFSIPVSPFVFYHFQLFFYWVWTRAISLV